MDLRELLVEQRDGPDPALPIEQVVEEFVGVVTLDTTQVQSVPDVLAGKVDLM